MSRSTPVPDNFDALLAAWFEGDAQVHEPETLLYGVIDRTSRTRPLPAWRLPERWIHMDLALRLQPARQRLAPIVLVILLAAAIVAGALIIGSRQPTKLPPPFGLAANGQIVYVGGDQLYRANADGSSSIAMTNPDIGVSSPIFSRDGTRYAYRRLNGGTQNTTSVDMLIADADGSNLLVIDRGATAMTNPSWSPDGRELAFVHYAGPDPFAPGAGTLIVAAADGSSSTAFEDLGLDIWGPSFSPDGALIAVATADGSLYVVNRDGTGARELTKNAYPEVGFKGLSAIWSSDGKTLLFSAGLSDVEGRTIYAVGLDGVAERPFSPGVGSQDDAAFSPDGKHVAFLQQAFSDRGPIVVVTDATGRVSHALPGIFGWHMPEWSPDGTKIAVLDPVPDAPDAPAGRSAIVILDAFGTDAPRFIYIPERDDGEHPDYTLTWQRLALP